MANYFEASYVTHLGPRSQVMSGILATQPINKDGFEDGDVVLKLTQQRLKDKVAGLAVAGTLVC
jgi:hypothetical protein